MIDSVFWCAYFMFIQIVGVVLLLLCAFCLSSDKRAVMKHWHYVVFAILFEIFVIFAMTHISSIIKGVEAVAFAVMSLKNHVVEGTKFVFGFLGGGDAPFEVTNGGNLFIFAFQALPMIILVSALCAVLTYLRVIPVFSKIIGTAFGKIYGIKQQLGMYSAVKIFLGQFEAPMVIKNSLPHLSTNEIFILVAAAFSTSSASLMAVYASLVEHICSDAITHVIMASVVGMLSTILVCVIMMPCFDKSKMMSYDDLVYTDFMTSLNKGISDGAAVWWAIVGSLIGMVALVSLVNYLLALFPNVCGAPLSLQRICGIIVKPFSLLFGIRDCDVEQFSQILGLKFVTNEMVAYFDLAKTTMSPESVRKAIYAITNFGNFACIGMTVGGLSAMCPNRSDIALIGGKAFLAGTIATFITTTLMCMFI